ncbi:MAG: mechanosensitive ion channel family protein [Candidatus Bathyarchaeota archaeon]|nr:mechanosensitive ion channel family protein [Candidatus Bathyarchaeota archaeon]
MMQRKITLAIVVLALVVALWYYPFGGSRVLAPLISEHYAERFISALILFAGLTIGYILTSLIIKSTMLRVGAKEGEIIMINNVIKACLILAGIISVLSDWFSLGALGSVFAAFGGMFLGWSLQAPITGVAGWLLISIIRPFSVGDRVQLPSYGLVGDVVAVTPLYTVLNQVGGSVGSEEPVNRTILIPNAMLFGTLIINYTPKEQEKLIETFRKRFSKGEAESGPAYILDEFVLRITFDSDWDEAERILLDAAREVTADIIKATGQEPYIRADVSDWYGVFMRLRFMTHATERPRIMYELTKKIIKAIQESDKVDIAIPFVYSMKRPFPIQTVEGLNVSASIKSLNLKDITVAKDYENLRQKSAGRDKE